MNVQEETMARLDAFLKDNKALLAEWCGNPAEVEKIKTAVELSRPLLRWFLKDSLIETAAAFASADHLVSLSMRIKALAADYEDALADTSAGAETTVKNRLFDYQNACDELNRVTQIRNIMVESERVCVDAGLGHQSIAPLVRSNG